DDVDRLVALDLGGLEVLLIHEDVLALLELERLHDLVVGHRLALLLADLLVADRARVLLVDEVETELVLLHRAVQPHGHVDGPDCGPRRSARSRASALRTSCVRRRPRSATSSGS